MELKEINELREKLHHDIKFAVQLFEEKTGLRVSDVTILRAQQVGRPSRVQAIHTDVRLP